mgnify:FL=1
MVKVSVIVPVFNAEKTLSRCIDSIVNQSYKNIEIILVNDGSSDSSKDICEKYAEKYSNIYVINQKNSGPATARNRGIDAARGKYICFADAHVDMENSMVKIMVEVAEKNNVEMVICGYFQEIGKNTEVHTFSLEEGLYCGNKAQNIAIQIIDDVSKNRIPPYSWNRLIQLDFLKKTGIRYSDGMVRSEDYFFFVQLHFQVNRLFLLSNIPLYHYTDVETSITHTYIKGYWESVATIYNSLNSVLPNELEIKKRLDKMLLQRTLIALNNASRSTSKKEYKYEINKILKSSLLKSVFRKYDFRKGIERFGIFYFLINCHLHIVIYLRYLFKFYFRW